MISSAIATVWVIVGITLYSEMSDSFHTFLTNLTWHHWVSKSIIAIVLFALLSMIFKGSEDSESVLKSSKFLVVSVVLGGLIIFGYFVFHYMSA